MAFAMRIQKETKDLLRGGIPGISASVNEDNMHHFNIHLSGPSETCYAGGQFRLELYIPDNYPMAPPKVRFLTPVWHPNVDRLGRICLNILTQNEWSPALQIRGVLLSIQALMSTPNPDDPLNNAAAKVWIEEPEKAMQIAKEWTEKYAKAQ
ncbi:Ubiquitin--protein ligase [Carpediemonas membranifera]|uniref:E2 ubiquitin-conjugating enzyme n=1 Tax=Carpediemonas membranifera TaxID=201153 RepID=A0A8J6AP85_9EUKA|nr:Ubiquitin--protein ligase [Carpediemonas membranifera]|eukprot:KAG9389611.1 Ubiquitin--protein ligase [Carpediemonas membranifera]